jgi:hypothetical protein
VKNSAKNIQTIMNMKLNMAASILITVYVFLHVLPYSPSHIPTNKSISKEDNGDTQAKIAN